MHSSSNDRQSLAIEVFVLLCAMCVGGCGQHDGRSTVIQKTIDELAANAQSWNSYDSDEARLYWAPAFRRAIPLLQKDGVKALPMVLVAKFWHAEGDFTGLGYGLDWLELDNSVRGFYLRLEGEQPDIDLYPVLCKKPQVPNTAWMSSGGPVLCDGKERSDVPSLYAGTEIVLDARVLEEEKILVGLILADGRKTVPVQAYLDPRVTGELKLP